MNRKPEQILDELLVLRAQSGDRAAIGLLVERWQTRLIAHVRVMVNDHQTAADIVQETWLAIFKGLRRLQDPAAFPGWAKRIAHRQAVNWIRQQSRDRTRSLTNAAETESDQATSTESGNRHDAKLQSLRDAIQQLDPQQRVLLRMFYHEKLSIADISKIVNVPVGTLKHRLFKLRQRLKSIIERQHNETAKH